MKKSGFSLVELMIVVAIIGILSALAIPNFLKYRAKAKQTEAKINLAALYMAEKSFGTEYNTYTSYLGSLGYKADGIMYYRFGFKDTFPATISNTQLVLPLSIDKDSTQSCPDSDFINNSISATSFVAEACGRISDATANNQYDHWTIDENKKLTNIVSGI